MRRIFQDPEYLQCNLEEGLEQMREHWKSGCFQNSFLAVLLELMLGKNPCLKVIQQISALVRDKIENDVEGRNFV